MLDSRSFHLQTLCQTYALYVGYKNSFVYQNCPASNRVRLGVKFERQTGDELVTHSEQLLQCAVAADIAVLF